MNESKNEEDDNNDDEEEDEKIISRINDDDDTKNFIRFYIDLIENNTNTLRYYCADKIVLDWFGKTIKGGKKLTMFLKSNSKFTHFLSNIVPVNKIGFRHSHRIESTKDNVITSPNIITYVSRSSEQSSPNPDRTPLPLKQTSETNPSTSSTINYLPVEMGQGDGIHNNNYKNKMNNYCDTIISSPTKKLKLDCDDIIENESSDKMNFKYLTADGSIEFHRPSLKKMQIETKWKRPCKLHVAYTVNSNRKDYTIYLIIYEGNMKCRRNLLNDFAQEQQNNND